MIEQKGWIRIAMLVIALAALTALAAACSSDDDEDDPSSAGIKTGGTLRVGMLADHSTLDPPSVMALPDIVTVQATYDVLVNRNPDQSLEPMLATSWEANADGTEWTFKLREGVKFADGREFTSEDVIFTFNRMFEVESPLSSVMANPSAIVAVDDHTVRFEFSKPNAVLLESIVKYHAHITPANLPTDRALLETFGTGPFRMTELIVGERAVFERNPDYFWGDRPYVDRVEYIFLPDPTARAEALKAGVIDIIYDLDIASIPGLQDHPDTSVLMAPTGGYMNMAMDVRVAPFDDVLVRKALQAATDRNAILQVAQFGMGAVAFDHPITAADPVFNDACKPPDYDPELAKSLLAEAGFPNGIDITLFTSTAGAAMVEMSTAFKEGAAPAGINVNIEVAPEDGYWSDIWLVKPFATAWFGGRPPFEAISVAYPDGAPWNDAHWANARVDELLDEALGAGDLEVQKDIYGELQCIIIDQVPRIIPVFRPVTLGVRNDVKGIEPLWDATMTLHNVWLDR